MWEENKDRIMVGALTAVALSALLGFGTFMVDSIEARAENWVQKRMDERIVRQNAIIDGKYGKIEARQNATGAKVDAIEKQFRELNKNLTQIILQRSIRRD